jgi:hypothetical protein
MLQVEDVVVDRLVRSASIYENHLKIIIFISC